MLRSISAEPVAYKLGIKPNGEFVLLGRYDWIDNTHVRTQGSEWRVVPTVKLDEQGKEM